MPAKKGRKLGTDGQPTGLNISEFAELVGVSENAVREGLKRGRVVLNSEGWLDPKTQVARWHMTRDKSKVRGRPAVKSTPAASLKAAEQFEKLKVKKAEIDVAIAQETLSRQRSETVSREEVRRAISDFSRLLSAKLTNFPSRYGLEIAAAANCEPRPLIAALDKFMRAQIEELSSVKPMLPD